MTIVSPDKNPDTTRQEEADPPSEVQALFPEAEQYQRWRQRRFLIVAIAALFVAIGAILVATVVHRSGVPAAFGAVATRSVSGVPAGEPASEVVSFEVGNRIVLDQVTTTAVIPTSLRQRWATTLGVNPELREWQYAPIGTATGSRLALVQTDIEGVEYIPNSPSSPVVLCSTRCKSVKTPWIEVAPPSSWSFRPTVEYDPVLALSAVRHASVTGLAKLGGTQLDGVATTEYSGSITAQSVARIKGDARVSGIYNTLLSAAQGLTGPRANSKLPVTVWVDRNGRVRKIEVAFSAPATSSSTFNGHWVLTFGQFGKAVPVLSPSSGQVTTIREPDLAHALFPSSSPSDGDPCPLYVYIPDKSPLCR